MRNRNTKQKGGFTVVELVVAVGIFIVAMGLITGSFSQILRTQRRVSAQMAVNSAMSVILEQMAREMRSGYGFSFMDDGAASCPFGQTNMIEFTRARGNVTTTVAYRWNAALASVERSEGGDGQFAAVTPENVRVNRLCFSDTRQGDVAPWRITVSLSVAALNQEVLPVEIQTTVSARILPNEVQ